MDRCLEEVFKDIADRGDKYVLKKEYMKDKFRQICLDE
jgi:hypothetical protein